MDCKDIKKLTDKYIDEELDENLNFEFKEHLENCVSCKQEFEETIAVVNLLNKIPDQDLPEGFESQLHGKLLSVEQESGNKILMLFNNNTVRALLGMAAGFLIIVLAFGFSGFGMMSSAPASETKSQGIAITTPMPQFGEENKNDYYYTSPEPIIETSGIGTPAPTDSSSDDSSMNFGPKGSGAINPNNGTSNTASPAPSVDNLIETAGFNLTSSDFAGDSEKITETAQRFGVNVTKSPEGSDLSLRVIKTDYNSFLASLKNTFGASLVESGSSVPGSDGSDDGGINADYVEVQIQLVK